MSQARVTQLVEMRNVLAEEQRRLLVEAVMNLNMRYRELLKNDFGSTLVRNCAWDVADTLAVRFFKTADFYLSPQQLYHRIVSFSYDDPYDPLGSDADLRKLLYENQNGPEMLRKIAQQVADSQVPLFPDERDQATKNAQSNYKVDREDLNDTMDDFTGSDETFTTRKDGVETSELDVDHRLSRSTLKYSARYTSSQGVQDLKSFANSASNFWLIDSSANRSKGAVRVCSIGGKIVYMTATEFKNSCEKGECTEKDDITWKASAEQVADATIAMWEKETSSEKIQKLKDKGYLDGNGKVSPEGRKKLIQSYREAMNAESLFKLLPHKNEETGKWETVTLYENVAIDAAQITTAATKRIITGQVIYYVLPPLVFETKTILKKRNMTLERFFTEIKKSGKRITTYVCSKLGEIFKNIVGNTFHKFIKSFFDIIISLVRETVRRMIQIAKQLVLSLVNCIKIIGNRNSTPAQKADSVMKLMASSVVTIALEILFEYLEKQFNLPDILMEPLQIIVTILATNLTMLILQKLDLFDVQYGFLVSNIDAAFAEEQRQLQEQGKFILEQSKTEMSLYMKELKEDIQEIESSLMDMDLYQEDVTKNLERLNQMFDMGIDFSQEWNDFCKTEAMTGVK